VSQAKILVVDDDLDNRLIIRAALQVSDFDVCEAADGLEALDVVAKEMPDLILLDLSMPRLNGWEVARRLKGNPAFSNIPIFAFTAHAMAGDEKKAREAGCDDYVTKPCIPREVVAKIKLHLQGRKEGRHA